MKEQLRKSLLKIGGQHLKIVESPKSKLKKHKKTFVEIVNRLKDQHYRSKDLHKEFGIDTTWYEDNYFQIIEQLIIENYGELTSEAIFWWVYDVPTSREENYSIEEETSGKRHIIRTTTQLYNTLKKLKLLKKE